MFLKPTSNALTSIYFRNLILLYIYWIVMFLKFANIKTNPILICFLACHPHMTTLKLPSSSFICSSKSLKCSYYGKAPYFSFLLPPVLPGKHFCQAIHLMFPIQNNSPHVHQHSNTFLRCFFSKNLTNT